MPAERREICFDDRELMDAVASYGRHTPGVLPDGPLRRVIVASGADGGPVVTVVVELTARWAGEVADVRLNAESILEVLIWFCQQQGIPMPRFGDKHVAILNGRLALVIDYRGSGQEFGPE